MEQPSNGLQRRLGRLMGDNPVTPPHHTAAIGHCSPTTPHDMPLSVSAPTTSPPLSLTAPTTSHCWLTWWSIRCQASSSLRYCVEVWYCRRYCLWTLPFEQYTFSVCFGARPAPPPSIRGQIYRMLHLGQSMVATVRCVRWGAALGLQCYVRQSQRTYVSAVPQW